MTKMRVLRRVVMPHYAERRKRSNQDRRGYPPQGLGPGSSLDHQVQVVTMSLCLLWAMLIFRRFNLSSGATGEASGKLCFSKSAEHQYRTRVTHTN